MSLPPIVADIVKCLRRVGPSTIDDLVAHTGMTRNIVGRNLTIAKYVGKVGVTAKAGHAGLWYLRKDKDVAEAMASAIRKEIHDARMVRRRSRHSVKKRDQRWVVKDDEDPRPFEQRVVSAASVPALRPIGPRWVFDLGSQA